MPGYVKCLNLFILPNIQWAILIGRFGSLGGFICIWMLLFWGLLQKYELSTYLHCMTVKSPFSIFCFIFYIMVYLYPYLLSIHIDIGIFLPVFCITEIIFGELILLLTAFWNSDIICLIPKHLFNTSFIFFMILLPSQHHIIVTSSYSSSNFIERIFSWMLLSNEQMLPEIQLFCHKYFFKIYTFSESYWYDFIIKNLLL